MNRSGDSKKPIFTIIYIVVVVAALGFGLIQWKQSRDIKKNPNKAQDDEIKRVTSAVSKLYKLPDETPTLATVQDKSKLKDQDFFKDAENGDKLLIFQGARQAIIYRAKTNKLINVGPIAITDQPGGTEPAASAKVTVAIVGSAGDIDVAVEDLADLADKITIGDKIPAKGKISSTVVIDTKGSHADLAKSVAGAVAGKVGQVAPNGQPIPAGDIIVFMGL